MFGYVVPCKMELKIKDYEKFKAYYCGLCKTIKSDFGNLPRLTLNYDMTFLAILLDSIDTDECKFVQDRCMIHPVKKRIILISNSSLKHAAFCNIILSYFKLLDNVSDDKSVLSNVYSHVLKTFIKKCPKDYEDKIDKIKVMLDRLYSNEKNPKNMSLDELSNPFAELTAYLMVSFKDNLENNDLYKLGYNLGKWIYIIDAFDDLQKDMEKGKFNALNALLNTSNKMYNEFREEILERVKFILISCGRECLNHLNKLSLSKNEELLYNILQFGLLEKMDRIFKRSENKNEKPI